MKRKSGFTLLEIIIVVIIVGVLAGLALPRFINVVERSRATEALSNLGSIRQSMNRCYLITSDFQNCDFARIDLENPNTPATRLFNYAFSNVTVATYDLTATSIRDATDTIMIEEDGTLTYSGAYTGM